MFLTNIFNSIFSLFHPAAVQPSRSIWDSILAFFNTPIQSPVQNSTQVFDRPPDPGWIKNSDYDIVAKTLWGEARGEGAQGMQAVANVIYNRWAEARAGKVTWWGFTFKDICLYPYQFSCWNLNDPNRPHLDSLKPGVDASYDQAYSLAKLCISGSLPDLTHGSDSYYARYIAAPDWAIGKPVKLALGQHLFYNVA